MIPEEAEHKIRESDHERRELLMHMFGKERVEHARYDIALWMDEFAADDAVEILKTAIRVWCERQARRRRGLRPRRPSTGSGRRSAVGDRSTILEPFPFCCALVSGG